MTKRKIQGDTPAFRRRQEIWRHNGFMGYARMMQMQAQAIIRSNTATSKAKMLATTIYHAACELSKALVKRSDQE